MRVAELPWAALLEYYMETLNGVFVILLANACIWLTYYIFEQKRIHSVSLIKVTTEDGPLGVRLAIPMLTLKFGLLLRAVIWGWVELGPGHKDLQLSEFLIVVFGSLLVVAGFLCLIRVLTKPRFGSWPWLVVGAVVLMYVVVAQFLFFLGLE